MYIGAVNPVRFQPAPHLARRYRELSAQHHGHCEVPIGTFLAIPLAPEVDRLLGPLCFGHLSGRRSEIDLGLLIWGLERSVDPDAFGAARTVVRLNLIDQPKGKDVWWFMNHHSKCELCLEDPGHETDLYLACTLPDMIYIVRGDLRLSAAIESGQLDVHGTREVCARLERWLNLSPLATVESQRQTSV